METQQIPKINPEFINNIFRNIEARNHKVVEEIKENKKEFDEKAEKIIKFIQFRNKVDKLECAYSLMTTEKEKKEIDNLTNQTKKELWEKALKKSNGNKKKAISLLFDPSSEIKI